MSKSQNPFFDAALSLSQTERADLAFQLLQSLDQPGDEVSSQEFGDELRARIEAYRRGESGSDSLDDVRIVIERQVSRLPAT